MTDAFIAMCAAAEELQAAWIPKPGDWISNNGAQPFLWCGEPIGPMKDYIWCPHIEDMVDIIGVERLKTIEEFGFDFSHIGVWFYEYEFHNGLSWACEADSFPSALLQYLMYKLFAKEWDGKTWVK